jgi:hypothetical protein
MNLNVVPTGLKWAIFVVFMLFYLPSVAKMWLRAWTRSVDELLAVSDRFGSPRLTPLRWLEERPNTWLWLHRVSSTFGLIIALLAAAALLLNLLGILG